MPLYEKRWDKTCGDCHHFCRHYVREGSRFCPLHLGHCTFPRIKDREEGQSCSHWTGKKK